MMTCPLRSPGLSAPVEAENTSGPLTRLTEARESAGYTKQSLAEQAGISAISVYNYERGTSLPRPATQEKIAITVSDSWSGSTLMMSVVHRAMR